MNRYTTCFISLQHLSHLAAAIICIMFFKGIISLMPILIGIIVGYIYSAFIGILDFTTVLEAKWFEFPEMLIPGVDYEFVITPTLLSSLWCQLQL